MAYEFKLPDLGEGLTEGEIARWLVAEGQEIGEDDPLVEIQTDKTTVEIPSPAAGKVARILVAEGEVVPVGTVLVVIGEDGADGAETARSQGQSLGHVSEGRREPLRGVRRLIADHMARAHREVPPVTWVEECDFSAVPLERLVATVLKACAGALAEYPELNARLEGDEIVYLDRYDLGFAVQTDQGLVVPVVRACDSRSIDELDADIRRLADAAREGTLKPEELRGSTFTVSSAGKLAGLFQTPIVNHPEVAILSIGRVTERAVVRDGEIVARPVGYVALTFDHRVVDGARAAEFGLAVVRRLEQPSAAS